MAYDFFGPSPVTVVMGTSDSFNGTAQTETPSISGGVVTFPNQSGGGLVDFHKRGLKITKISYASSGTATISIVYPGSTPAMVLGSITNSGSLSEDIYLPTGAKLSVSSTGGSGAKYLAITAVEAWPSNSF